MRIIESFKDKTESLTKILFAVAVLLGALVFLKIGFFVNASKATMIASEADLNGAGGNDLKKSLAQTKASAEELKKKNLFVPAPPRQYPINEVIGILGHEVLVGDKWYKVGDNVGEAKIVAIEPTKARIVWDGQEKEFSPIVAGGSGGGPDRSTPPGKKPGSGGAGKVVVGSSRPGPGQGTAGNSAAEREKMRQRFLSASPEEKQRLRDEMRQRPGARGQ
jgi:hypothetical protein